MSSKIKSLTTIVIRVVLGLIYFVFGLNFFFHFIPTPPAEGIAETFTTGLFLSGYFFPVLKGLEIILGALLLARYFVPLVLVMLMPISINILLFHVFLAPEGSVLSILMVTFNLYLAWVYRKYYKPFFTPRASLSA